jgi:hypothetical protein
MNRGGLPVSNARYAITALGTAAQQVFAAVSGAEGSLTSLDLHVYCAGGGVIIFESNDAFATGTITVTGTPLAGETLTVGSLVWVFAAAAASDGEIQINADNTIQAAAIAAAINGTDGYNIASDEATATSALGVVTVTAIVGGTQGNVLPLSDTATGVAVSGATFTDATVTEFFRVTISGNGTQQISAPLAFAKSKGLALRTTSASGAGVTIHYYQPGALGIGA